MNSMNPGRKIDVMGIINITDNSYYAESRCLTARETMTSAALSAVQPK